MNEPIKGNKKIISEEKWPESPYSDVYLIDTGNLASAQTEDIKDVYDMLADALFEDFSTAEFANKKRSISVNQNQYKTSPYSSRRRSLHSPVGTLRSFRFKPGPRPGWACRS